MVAHCRDTLRLGTSVKHCRDTHWLGTAGILGGWALQGYFAVGHIRQALQGYSLVLHWLDTWWLGTAGILGGWSLKSASSRARTTSTLKSNNPTARVGNKPQNSIVYAKDPLTHLASSHFGAP